MYFKNEYDETDNMTSPATQKMLGSSFMCKISLKWKENCLGSSHTYEGIASQGGH